MAYDDAEDFVAPRGYLSWYASLQRDHAWRRTDRRCHNVRQEIIDEWKRMDRMKNGATKVDEILEQLNAIIGTLERRSASCGT